MHTYPYKTIGNILPKIKDSVDDIYTVSVMQFIKFCVEIVPMYMLMKRADALNTCLSKHRRDLKLINLAKLKENDLNKKTTLIKHCFNCKHRIDFGNFEILNYNIDYQRIRRNRIGGAMSTFQIKCEK